MSRFFGLQIEPNAQSAFQHDYWEEFTKVNDVFAHESDVVIKASKSKNDKKKPNGENTNSEDGLGEGTSKSSESSKSGRFKRYFREKAERAKGLVLRNSSSSTNKDDVRETELDATFSSDKSTKLRSDPTGPSIYPDLCESDNRLVDEIGDPSKNGENEIPSADDEFGVDTKSQEEVEKFISVAVQTDMSYMRDVEETLPYSCCFCCRSSTPCIVWAFVGISLIFFKMGAIVTGRWIYLSNSTFDEIVFYVAFTVCLAFATFYFRHGTKYHNPFDLMFLVLTIPLMWGLLAFTTYYLKKDIFFYVGSVIYTIFILPYIGMGSYIAYRFWTTGKLFIRRVEGDRDLEPLCKKLFFATSLMIFDGQLSICASIISMSNTVNYHESKHVWITSLVFGPISICITIVWMIVGYFAMRSENKVLTWIFSLLSLNQIVLVIGMILKRPKAPGAIYLFANAVIIFNSTIVLSVHICLLLVVWNWIVPAFGNGLKTVVRRTSKNNCIQCAQLTICR